MAERFNPRFAYVALDLTRARSSAGAVFPPVGVTIRPVVDADWPRLTPLASEVVRDLEGLGPEFEDDLAGIAANQLADTRAGWSGPYDPTASSIAIDGERDVPCGALLVVTKPANYLDDPDVYDWPCWRDDWPCAPGLNGVPAAGEPHIDWVFVDGRYAERGVASAMLVRAVDVLRRDGRTTLTTSFRTSNGRSMAWHWRNGFELLPTMTLQRFSAGR